MRIAFLLFCLFPLHCLSQNDRQATPVLTDTLLSYISIPIQLNLQSLFNAAEKSVPTVFTSPGYPDSWVEADCATRYQYHFKRSIFKMATFSNHFQLSFTGLYKVSGSKRVCAGTTVLSPWTPPCGCGFEEGERRVQLGFHGSFSLKSNHLVHLDIQSVPPQPLNKCTVCFWSQDITALIMKELAQNLALARKSLLDQYGVINLRPYLQKTWNTLNEVHSLNGLGYLVLHPKKLHMENVSANNNTLNLTLGITANPIIQLQKPEVLSAPLPDLTPSGRKEDFSVYLDAVLQYDSLSNLLTGVAKGKRIDIGEGLLKKHVIIENCAIRSDGAGGLLLEVLFSGSHKGTVYFTGRPVYNPSSKAIEIEGLTYDLATRDWLLKTARWLFDKRITNELQRYASFSLIEYYKEAEQKLNGWLNREWMKGVESKGKINELQLVSIQANTDHLALRTYCSGNMLVRISNLNWAL